jgi:hypothetical protein
MNVYDISQTRDPTKCYSKTIDESDCENWLDYNSKVVEQAFKLERGIFAFRGNFYFAEMKTYDLTYSFKNESNNETTICRKIKFKWKYVFLK